MRNIEAKPAQSALGSSPERVLVVRNHQRTCLIEVPLLRQLSSRIVRQLFPDREYEIGVHLVNPKAMVHLNETFLGHQGRTDVITFDYREAPESEFLHGEIFICVDEALVQANRFGAAWQSEVVRYLAHGMLHLAGYDDRHPKARQKMKRAEARLLKSLDDQFGLKRLGQVRPLVKKSERWVK